MSDRPGAGGPGNPAAVAEARAWIGTPFRHGASLRGAGADCLGLIRGVWRAVVGPDPAAAVSYGPHWSALDHGRLMDGLRSRMAQVDRAAPGDVLALRLNGLGGGPCAARHLGVLAERDGAPTLIHAWSGRGVVESPMGEAWRRLVVARFRFPERMA
jgi:NlpC/P60 family putative phage cell wall peptidase